MDNTQKAKSFVMAKFYVRTILVLAVWAAPLLSFADTASVATDNAGVGISSNPAAVNFNPGNGALESLFNLNEDSPLRIGGTWISDGDYLFTGGQSNRNLTGNSALILGLTLDTQKLSLWNGGLFGVQLLQFNGMSSNNDAGTIQGYDSLTGLPPLNRTELYQLWYRQSVANDKLIIRVGKSVPTYDFNNVIRPVSVSDEALAIPSVTGLLFTPAYVNPSMLGVLPGYYNSAYGITSTFAPNKQFYISAGVYDGNLANGTQTGLDGPHFNGYYFLITETGYAWQAGAEKKPGVAALGGWGQTGELTASNGVTEQGTQGLYAFGSQFLWYRRSGIDTSGISGYLQLGMNNSQTLPVQKYVGGGFTFFAFTRPKDSFGVGVASSWLNQNITNRSNEFMLQSYYQMYIAKGVYLEPTVTYIPTPGAAANIPQTVTGTLQLITLF